MDLFWSSLLACDLGPAAAIIGCGMMRNSLGRAFQRHVVDLLEIVRVHNMLHLIVLETFVLHAHQWTYFVFAAEV